MSTAARVPIGDAWKFELKFDGYRAITICENGSFELRSRHGTDMRSWFPLLTALPKLLGRDAVLDGEVVVLDERGHPDFNAIRRGIPTFVAFDVLRVDGRDVRDLQQRDRRQILDELVAEDALPHLMRSRTFTDGIALLAEAERLGLEGIVCKHERETYRSGVRSPLWMKIKTTTGRAQALERLSFSCRRGQSRSG